ncbi:hypothetical protein [Paraburkholderia sediminicola]|uniref:hypothetical protein n=1 Tax=Paraburkholderia sediminicola TaxID=458836 RepID=UPI0038BDD280
MQVQLYKWFEETTNQNRYEVVMLGHNKRKLAKFARAAKAQFGDSKYVSVNFGHIEVQRTFIDLKTLKLGPSWHEQNFYRVEVDFYINDPSAAAAAVKFKLTHF